MATATRTEYTKSDEVMLVNFLAKYTSDGKNRQGNEIYKRLTENTKKFPWAERHTWQSWRDHYMSGRPRFNRLIERLIDKHEYSRTKSKSLPSGSNAATQDTPQSSARGGTSDKAKDLLSRSPRKIQNSQPPKATRTEFTKDDDDHLARYIAYHGGVQGWTAPTLYDELTSNIKKWPWAKRHTAASWQSHYSKNRVKFDKDIRKIRKTMQEERKGDEENKADGGEADDKIKEDRDTGDANVPAVQQDKGKGREKRRRAVADGEDLAKKKRRVDESREGHAQPEDGQAAAEGQANDSSRERGVKDGEPNVSEVITSKPSHLRAKNPSPAQELSASTPSRPITSEERETQQVEAELNSPSTKEGQARDGDEQQVSSRLTPPPSDDYRGEIFDDDPEAAERPAGDGQPQIETLPDAEDEDEVEADDNDEEVDQLESDADEGATGQVSRPNSADTVRRNLVVAAEDRSGNRHYPDVLSLSRRESPRATYTEVQADGVATSHGKHRVGQPRAHVSGLSFSGPEGAGPSSSALVTSTPHLAKKRSRLSLVSQKQEEFFASATATPEPQAALVTPAPSRTREPPRLDEGAYNSAFTDALGRTRLSPRGRAYGVDQEADVGNFLGTNVDDIAWPPQRGKKAKGKERELPSPAAVMKAFKDPAPNVKPEPPSTQAMLEAMRRARSPDVSQDHHPFSQLGGTLQAEALHRAIVEKPHHPFSQVLPPTQHYTASQIADVLDALIPDDDEPIRPSKTEASRDASVELLEEDDMRVLDMIINKNADFLNHGFGDLIGQSFAEPSTSDEHGSKRKLERIAGAVHGKSPSQSSAGRQSSGGGETPGIPDSPHANTDLPPEREEEETQTEAEEAEDAEEVDDEPAHEEAEGEDDSEEEHELPSQLPRLPNGQQILPLRLSRESSIQPQAESSRTDRTQLRPFPPGVEWLQENKLVCKMMDEDVLPPYAKLDLYAATAAALTKLSQEHGFTEEVVLEKWYQAGSLHKVEYLLREMREGAEERAEEVSESMMVEDDPFNPELAVGNWRRSNSLLSSRRGSGSRRQSKPHRRWAVPANSKNVSMFEIELLTPEPVDEEYDPHPDSRAGRYVKLAREASLDGTAVMGSGRGALKRRQSSNADARDVEMILTDE